MSKKKICLLTLFSVLGLCVIIVLGVVIAGMTNKNKDYNDDLESTEQENTSVPELKIISTKESDNWVVVETTYGEFQYPAAFSDIIKLESITKDNSSQLQFFARIDEGDVLVYTIYYNNNIGERFGKLKLSENNEIAVFFVFEKADGTNSSDWLDTFYAIQDTFNDVKNSMSEDSRFTILE